jgi:hypothetical protein
MVKNPLQRNVTGTYQSQDVETYGPDGRPLHSTKDSQSIENTLNVLDQKARTPDYYDAQISSSMFWAVNRKGRKHVFLWVPQSTSLQLSFEDYGTGTVQGQAWFNVGIPDGTRVYAPTLTSTTIYLKICCTDEVIP